MTRTFDPALVTDTPQDVLGEIRQVFGGKFYQHVEADAAIAAERTCAIESDFGAQAITHALNSKGKLVGVSEAAIASGEFGWLCRMGRSSTQVAASCAAHTALRTTANAGRLDDATGGTTEAVDGIVLTAAQAASTGAAPCILNWPVGG